MGPNFFQEPIKHVQQPTLHLKWICPVLQMHGFAMFTTNFGGIFYHVHYIAQLSQNFESPLKIVSLELQPLATTTILIPNA